MDYSTTEAVTMGEPVVVGGIIGIPKNTCEANANGNFVALVTEGVFELPKAAVEIKQGTAVTWDASAKTFSPTAAGSVGNGTAWADASADDETVMVKINTNQAVEASV